MNKIWLLVLISLVFVGGCGNSLPEEEDDFVTSSLRGVDEQIEIVPDYVGTWSRVDTYVDGVAQGSVPATIVMDVDYYISSTSVCTVQGALTVESNQMNMLVEPNNCPGWTLDSLTYTYSIEKNEMDEDVMTFVVIYEGVEVKEIYKRKIEE